MTDSLKALAAQAAQAFEDRFGTPPRWTAVAPGRVNLIGDHTDYTGGLALPFAIDLFTVVCAAPGGQGLRLSSDRQTGVHQLDLDPLPEAAGNWTDYVLGVVAGYKQKIGHLPALDLHVSGNLPIGAGLSSSASLELAVAVLMESVLGVELPPAERALLCQAAEHRYAGVPCGILDQFSVAMARQGQLLRLDCSDQSVDWISCPEDVSLLVFDSGVSHALADGGYAERRRQCELAESLLATGLRDASLEAVEALEDPTLRSRARHVVTENRRVDEFIRLLGERDYAAAGNTMLASHTSLSGDYAVSTPELDGLVALAMEAGAMGARMTGGGFGGSVICIVPARMASTVADSVSAGYLDRFGLRATPRLVQPVGAAAMVDQHD